MSLTTSRQGVTTTVPVAPAASRVIDLTAADRLDARSALELREGIVAHLGDGPCLAVVDVTGVRHVTPSGLVGTLELLRTLRRHGGDLRLFGNSEALRQANGAADLGTITRVYATREQALVGRAERLVAAKPRRRTLAGLFGRR